MLIENLELPWFVVSCAKGEVALRLDQLNGFIVEGKSTDTVFTVILHLVGSVSGIEVRMNKKDYQIFLKGLTLYQGAIQ